MPIRSLTNPTYLVCPGIQSHALQDGNIQLRVSVLDDGSGRPEIGDIQAPQLSFGNIDIRTSDAKLAWLYNAVASLAHDQIQAAIIREVSKQVLPNAHLLFCWFVKRTAQLDEG